MNFDLTPEQDELRRTMLDFCRRKLPSDGGTTARDASATFDRERWALCARQGLMGLTIPERYGGSALETMTAVLLMEAMGQGCDDAGLLFSISAHAFACVAPLYKFGDDAQREKWLPAIATGERIACHSITEPGAGSDIFAMRTTAARDGDDYVLDGSKCYATNGPVADVFLVHAKTDPDKGFFGLSAFIVERGTPGFTIGRPYEKVGLRTSPMADLYFDECRIPASQRIGREGAGAPMFTYSMNWERTCLFALYVGAMQRIYDRTVEFAKERKQFGQPVSKFQAVSHRIVDMRMRLETARLMLYRAAWNLEKRPNDTLWPSMAKLFISEAAVQQGLDAMQVHGGAGAMAGEIERFLRDALPSRIFSGTSEIQRNNIARALRL